MLNVIDYAIEVEKSHFNVKTVFNAQEISKLFFLYGRFLNHVKKINLPFFLPDAYNFTSMISDVLSYIDKN